MAIAQTKKDSIDFPCAEIVEVSGHIIDSLLLPKIMDEILARGGAYDLEQIDVGHGPTDTSYARIKVQAKTAHELEDILEAIQDHGATPIKQEDCAIEIADMDGAFPEAFYSTTNQ